MDNSLTILFILLAAVVAVIIRRVKRDNCLKSFEHNNVEIEKLDSSVLRGNLNQENTGLEITFKDINDNILTRLLYKYEYDNIFLIIRDPKKQTDKLKNKIQKERKAQSNQRRSLHFGRKIFNILKTLKDSLMEIVNLMLTQTKKTGPVGDIITTQDAYVNKIKAELAGTVNNSFEPLLEKYIYRKVLVEVLKNNDVFNITGILTKYTANFIRINNMTYKRCLSR
jgi:hypothetical protein